MKQRMYNTFFRIFKNKKMAKVLSNIGHTILVCYYMVARLFLKKKSDLTSDDAYKIMQKCSKKPNMEADCINKKLNKDLSIIVPAYNAEKTIKECIDSVIKQITDIEYELIIINDGSKDKTGQLVLEYTDEHIVLIEQENRGFSGARNRGIDESTGRYIMFLDSDDMLADGSIDRMMKSIIKEEADIVQGNYYSFVDGNGNYSYSQLKAGVYTDKEDIIANPGYPWAKIYKRELFDNLRFPLNVWFEDTIVCMILFRMCRKVVVIDNVVYAWRINPNGITQNARKSNKCIDHYWVMEYVLEQSEKIGLLNDELQYNLVKSHMSTLLYRRISLMSEDVIESAFVMACDMLDEIRPQNYEGNQRKIERDIETAFKIRNYKLWKLASFIV